MGEWKETEYGKKLRDPRWQKKRLEVLQRDEFACQKCFDTKSTLDVHHLWYNPILDPWDYPISALITLCEACHEEETETLGLYTGDLVLMLNSAARCQVTSRSFARG